MKQMLKGLLFITECECKQIFSKECRLSPCEAPYTNTVRVDERLNSCPCPLVQVPNRRPKNNNQQKGNSNFELGTAISM